MSELLKQRILDDVKAAMRGRDKQRLGALRLLTAAIKQQEVDERIELTDEQVLTIINRMVKQRRESITQYSKAGRDDLIAIEQFELDLLAEFLPEQLSEAEVVSLIDDVVTATQASSMRDMGKVMGQLKSKIEGSADMSIVSALVKQRLSQ